MKRKFLSYLVCFIVIISLLCIPVSADWESDMDTEGSQILGDLDFNGTIDNQDVEYLLWHTLFPNDYPLQIG